ncbi:MAG: PD40 domain-containing protein, partial [Planctomycetes bacterium]|nr:PD40 domain-containing protein [Planctomycetota bacterium]
MKRISLGVIAIASVAVAAGLSLSRKETQTQSDSTVKLAEPVRAIGAIQPRLSPDGSRIAFSYQGAIWTMPTNGGTMTRLTDAAGFDGEPVWSPDGKQIAYVHSASGSGGRLRLIDAADGAAVKLPQPVTVTGSIRYQKLEFHPEGGRVLGVFRRQGINYGLAWYDLKTGKLTTVTTLPRRSRYALSRDGNTILYTKTMDVSGQQGGNNGPQAELWRIPSTGGKAVKITKFDSRIHDLCFAADDKSVFAVSELGGVHYDLWRIRLLEPGTSSRKITQGQADEDRPSVSKNGRWLLYTDNRNNATALVLRDLTDGSERT